MKQLFRFGGVTLTLAGAMFAAESWSGTVVDVMCKNKDLANHTRECALGCSKGGYGLVLADGKFLKFDEAGNAKTLAALKSSLPIPVPIAVIIARISSCPSILSYRAFSTFRILPRKGRIA